MRASARPSHCTAADLPPLASWGRGVVAVGVDATWPSVAGRTASAAAWTLGEIWDRGTGCCWVVPTRYPGGRPTSSPRPHRVDLADRLGFDRLRLAHFAVLTPTCIRARPCVACRALTLP
jgi:hypothetical protein